MMKSIKAVLLDLDETILDRSRSLELFLSWEASEYLNLPLDQCNDYIDRFIELDNNGLGSKLDIYDSVCDEFGLDQHCVESLNQHYYDDFDRFVCEKRHITPALELLRDRGYRLGVVSNGQSPFQENNLTALGIRDLFTIVVVSAAVGIRKPDPAIFALAASNLGVAPEECVFVGDNPRADIDGANAAGMFTVFVPTRRHPACAHADRVCRDMRDLPALVFEVVAK